MSNSPMVVHTRISPNKNANRKYEITRISPHCVVGQCTAESLGEWFAKESTQASSNYGIDKDGRIGMYVEEKDRSWCTSSGDNDHRAITIECASDTKSPYTMKEIVYEKLIELCVDICKRNGKTKLIWFGDKDKTLGYKPASDEMVLTVHRWFANKSCPGDWLYSRMDDLASKVTAKLNVPVEKEDEGILYRVQIGAYEKIENAKAMVDKLKAAGFNAIIKVDKKESVEEKKEPVKEEPWVPKIGDIVMFNGNTHYQNANATTGYKCSAGKAKITGIYQLGKSKHPYHLVQTGKEGPYGWVDANSFTKI